MRTNCQAQPGLLETLYGFGLDAIQKTERAEKNVNKLSGSPGKRNFLEAPIIQGRLYLFGLSFVQKTKKTEQNVNELFGPPGKRSSLAFPTPLGAFYIYKNTHTYDFFLLHLSFICKKKLK